MRVGRRSNHLLKIQRENKEPVRVAQLTSDELKSPEMIDRGLEAKDLRLDRTCPQYSSLLLGGT